MKIVLALLLTCSIICVYVAEEFGIGAIFDNVYENSTIEQILFEIAIYPSHYPYSDIESNFETQLNFIPHIAKVQRFNAINTEHEVCKMLSSSVIAVFGPHSRETIPIVRSICDVKEIPHIITRYDASPKRSICGINLYPHPYTLSKAYSDVIRKLRWSSFIILYEDNESLIRVSDLLHPEKNLSVSIQQLTNGEYRNVFRHIIKLGETNILLDCSIERLPDILKQAQQTGAMINKYNYIITCLDFHTIDLEPYKYSGVKIFGFRLFNPSKPYIRKILRSLAPTLQKYDYEPEKISTEAALMFDAVNLLTKTLQEKYLELATVSSDRNLSENNVKYISAKTVPSCYDENSWKYGFSIISDIKITEMKGLTGLIKFDYEGFRSNIEMQIIELKEDGIREKGIWNMSQGDKMIFVDDPPIVNLHDFRNITFKVIIPMTKPYGMRKLSPSLLEGNERFEGYAVDLLYELSLIYHFKYEIFIQEDGSNGSPRKVKDGAEVWDGMIGAVVNKTADLAIGDVTMTTDRTRVVDFSSPLMELGISILYKKPTKQNPILFSFLAPFSNIVWLLVITASLGMALQLFVMARLSPFEWTNPYPCVEEPEELENQFTFSNSLWFTVGALMQQGSDIAPSSPSTRIAAGVWWFFTLIMVSSYTANLAAFLTIENEVSPFSDAYELSRQSKIAYGAKKNGATAKFFEDSQIPEYQDIYQFMVAHPEMMTENNECGVRKVLESKSNEYAFFMESSTIDYEKEQHCELAQIGPLLDSKNYGIAMRKGEWYFKDISNGVLLLQIRGTLTALKRKWWKEKYSKNCQEDKKNDAETLKLQNVGGVFLVLIVGVIIGFVIVFTELVYHWKRSTRSERPPLKRELARELKFILKRKPIKPAYKPDEKSLLGSQSGTNNSIPNSTTNDDIQLQVQNFSPEKP